MPTNSRWTRRRRRRHEPARRAPVAASIQDGWATVSDSFGIVIPAYNAAAFVHAAIASIARADGLASLDRVVVVDDASEDATAEVARRALDACGLPGSVLRNDRNLGASAARARGFAQLSSPLIACVDADDLCLPHRFVDALRVLEDARVQLVGGDLEVFDDPREPPAHAAPAFASGRRIRMPTRGDDIAAALVFQCPIYASTTTFRRAALASIPLPAARVGEDWLFAHRIVHTFGAHAVANTGSVLMRYRRHARQLTKNVFLDNAAVFPVWDEILQQALGLQASRAELELHAKFSSPGRKPRPSRHEWARWQAWSARLASAAVAADYVPAALARALAKIAAELEGDPHVPAAEACRLTPAAQTAR